MVQNEELEEPNGYADLGMRLAIIAILIVGLIVLSTSAYGSVEDLSGPATAPPTTAPAEPTAAEASETSARTPKATVSLEAVIAPPPIRVLTPEELAVVEAESVEETDRSRLAPTGAVDETPSTLAVNPDPETPDTAPDATDSEETTPEDGASDETASDEGASEEADPNSPSTTVPATEPAPEPSGPTVTTPESAPTEPAAATEPAE